MIEPIGTMRIALTASLLALCGCSGPVAPPPGSQPLGAESVRETSDQPAEGTTASPATAQSEAAAESTAENSPEAGGEQETATAASSDSATFTPPYPERSELFQPPPIEQMARPSLDEDNSASDNIRLLGFLGDEPRRAILSYNGQVQTMEIGGEIGGVEIVDLRDDDVTLRRGRQQWTLSLID